MLELGEQPYSPADAEWDAFVAAHPHGSLLQTTQWARLKNRFGWTSERVWLRRDGRLVAGAQVLFRSLAMGIVKMAYVPHGPLADWHDDEQLSVLFNQMDQAAYRRGAGLLKFEPRLWQDECPAADWEALYRRHGGVASADTIQPPRTLVVDLRPAEDDILAAMKQKTRYNIRLAERKGVVVRPGTPADFPTIAAMYQETGARDGFTVRPTPYYLDGWTALYEAGMAQPLLAEVEGRPVAAVILVRFADRVIYMYGASRDEARERMPNYLLQWEAIRWTQAQGIAVYDFWGAPDTFDESDRLWGVWRFKAGFNGQVVRFLGAWDYTPRPLLYRLYTQAIPRYLNILRKRRGPGPRPLE